jgi:dihydroorotase-like cyclic amidohydrolase
MGFDLVIRGATVVTPGHRQIADIGIADGRIAQLGGTMTGAQELAAGGLLAIPGGVDAHTHLVHQGPEMDGNAAGSVLVLSFSRAHCHGQCSGSAGQH